MLSDTPERHPKVVMPNYSTESYYSVSILTSTSASLLYYLLTIIHPFSSVFL